MRRSGLLFTRSDLDALLIERLADGSVVIYDQRSKNVHSLNASAAVVWETCAGGATEATIATALERRFGLPVEQDAVLNTIGQLRTANLIQVQGGEPIPSVLVDSSRRAVLGRAAMAAIPVMLTLTAAVQKASAGDAKSGFAPSPLPEG